jgi:putative transposase
MLSELKDFIQSNPDARELKRALAVQMYLNGYKHREVQESLSVSSGFISKWTALYGEQGVEGLKLKYVGSVGHLSPQQRQSVCTWLQSQEYWNLEELQAHIKEAYEVVFNSKQSYYTLFKEAGISWKKTQKRNPRTNPELVQKKKRRSRTG